jgi:hypothetical protein
MMILKCLVEASIAFHYAATPVHTEKLIRAGMSSEIG